MKKTHMTEAVIEDVSRYEYDAFGNAINAEETIANIYGFIWEMRDGITDMYYLKARYYTPVIGRFTQADTYHRDGQTYMHMQAMSIREGKGIVKPKPYAKTKVVQHVGGVKHKRNPWVSTTRRFASAEYFATYGGKNKDNPNPIVRIDLSKVNPDNILDISTKEKAMRILNLEDTTFVVRTAAFNEEVLIYGDVPQEAIIGFVGEE